MEATKSQIEFKEIDNIYKERDIFSMHHVSLWISHIFSGSINIFAAGDSYLQFAFIF